MTDTVLYDDACNFCKVLMDGILDWDRHGRLRATPIQSEEGRAMLAGVPEELHLKTFHLVRPDGTVLSGGPALQAVFAALPGGRAPGKVLDALPGATQAGYMWVARNRIAISKFVPGRLKRRATRRLREREGRPPA